MLAWACDAEVSSDRRESIMSDPDNVFLYLATYQDEAAAKADYDELKKAYKNHFVGVYDAGIVSKDADGKLHIHRHEKPTEYGVWTGLGIGAVLGLLSPVLLPLDAAVGAAAGGLVAHLSSGMARKDLEEAGRMLADGEAAIVIVGKERVDEPLAPLMTNADHKWESELGVDRAEFEAQLTDALRGWQSQ
jgi:uncharacterized membrane protein